jgi:hypothetical protein
MALDKNENFVRKAARIFVKSSPTETIKIKAGDYEIDVSGEALEALIDLAERRHQTLGEVLAQAIAVQKAIADAKANGGKVIIEPRDDSPRELVLA